MKIQRLLPVLLLIPLPTCTSQQIDHVLKVEYTSTADYSRGQVVKASQTLKVTRYYSPDGTVRTETQDFVHHHNTLTLSNEKLGYEIWMNADTKTATRVDALVNSVKNHQFGVVGEKQPLGQSNIQGYTCDGYQNTMPDGAIIKHWFCEDPQTGLKFLGRIETYMGNSTTVESLQEATPGLSLPAGFFSVPSDYTLVHKSPAEMFDR